MRSYQNFSNSTFCLSVICLQSSRSLVPCCWRSFYSWSRNPTQSSGWTQPTSVPNCVISHLKILEFGGYEGSAEERAFTAYILQRGLVLKTMTIHTRPHYDLQKKDYMLKDICQLTLDWPTCICLWYGHSYLCSL